MLILFTYICNICFICMSTGLQIGTSVVFFPQKMIQVGESNGLKMKAKCSFMYTHKETLK